MIFNKGKCMAPWSHIKLNRRVVNVCYFTRWAGWILNRAGGLDTGVKDSMKGFKTFICVYVCKGVGSQQKLYSIIRGAR